MSTTSEANHYAKKIYTDEAGEVAFLLGGIGTGTVSIGSRGQLFDWEIFNKPAKGSHMPNTHFAIWTRETGREPVAKILEARIAPPFKQAAGLHPNMAAGLPRLAGSRLTGEYPFVQIEFEDDQLPVQVNLEAFTPFIPLNANDSGIPGAYLTYSVTNTASNPVEVSIAGSLINIVGGIRYNRFNRLDMDNFGQNRNDFIKEADFQGLFMSSGKYAPDDIDYGSMSLTTTGSDVTCKKAWLRGEWFDSLHEFWHDFATDGRLQDLGYDSASEAGKTDTGSIAVHETLLPGETKKFTFILAWHFPNRKNGWDDQLRTKYPSEGVARNYYATLFANAWSAAAYMVRNGERLKTESDRFRNALYGCSLPTYVIEALANNITVLRSNTCFRLEDGTFLGYEGCFDNHGSCAGNCTHVWSYAQTLAFLFPELERNMRRTEFLLETDENGKMNFRTYKIFNNEWVWNYEEIPAAADGQLGSIMRVYREWKLSGDDKFASELWPKVKSALQYALKQWDLDEDGVPDGVQHTTYDIDFYGPNPLVGILLLGALQAAGKMAEYLGDREAAELYVKLRERSARTMDGMLFNGEYYIQNIEDADRYKYQFGKGCLSDQLLGQQFAHVYGLGYLLPEEHIRKAVSAVYRHNFKESFANHTNCQRTYVLNDEQGLVACTWPEGGRPLFPFIYSDEVWTGSEYQVAVHLIYEGFIEEGLSIVRAIRDRHDGYRRNPWNEVECGHHYVRSMSSWGLLIALSGFEFDLPGRTIGFKPAIEEDDFACFWSTGAAWGTYRQKRNPATGQLEPEVSVLYGDASGITVQACGRQWTIGSDL